MRRSGSTPKAAKRSYLCSSRLPTRKGPCSSLPKPEGEEESVSQKERKKGRKEIHFYKMKGDVGMSWREKKNKKMPTPRHKFIYRNKSLQNDASFDSFYK